MNTEAIGTKQVGLAPSPSTNSTGPAEAPIEAPSAEGSAILSAASAVEMLARLIQKQAATSRDGAKAERKAAREQQYRAEDQQVKAMRDKASSIRTGAWVSGGCTVAGGAFCVGAASMDPETDDGAKSKEPLVSDVIGKTLSGSADFTGKLSGDAPAELHAADAKAAELAATRAKDRGEDAKDRLQEIASLVQDAVQAIRASQAAQNETIQGILRRM